MGGGGEGRERVATSDPNISRSLPVTTQPAIPGNLGNLWLPRALSGSLAISGNLDLSWPILGYLRLSQIISGYILLPLVISQVLIIRFLLGSSEGDVGWCIFMLRSQRQ